MKRKFLLYLPFLILNLSLLGLLSQKSREMAQLGLEIRAQPSVWQTDSVKQIFIPELSYEVIFDDGLQRRFPENELMVLVATGDVMLGRFVNTESVRKNDFLWSFEKMTGALREADTTLVNLEGPFLSDCPVSGEGMKFCADPKSVDGLTFAGVDLVNLANNHIGDYGDRGIAESRQILESNDLTPVDSTGPVYQNIKGKRYAFLGYCQVCPEFSDFYPSQEKLTSQIRKANQEAEAVIVSFHWGEEYAESPNQKQKQMARLAIDLGADLVIGHHPHWIQPVEIYEGSLIVYSLGNFIFDQGWSLKTKQGLVARFSFFDAQLVKADFLPVEIKAWGQPNLLEGEKRVAILEAFREDSLSL